MRTIPRLLGLSLLTAVPLFGTAAAVVVSPLSIVAAIDSKEVNRQYLGDGTFVTEDRVACKVREAGPFFVAMVGIARAMGGLDVLRESVKSYQAGDSLDSLARRLTETMPQRLAVALAGIRKLDSAYFDLTFRNREVLQLMLLGVDDGRPRVVIVTFRSTESGVAAESASCPGNCQNPRKVYLLGIRDEAEKFLADHPRIVDDTRTPSALEWIHFAYASHPEVVGGPATVIRVTTDDAEIEQRGACADQRVIPLLERQLTRDLRQIENISAREAVSLHSKQGNSLRSKTLQADVRMVDGAEAYTWHASLRGRLPEPWCGGELATMLRVTASMLARHDAFVSADELPGAQPVLVLNFHAEAGDRIWQLVSGGRNYPLAFDGQAWFSQTTGQLLRIRWSASDQQLVRRTGITRITWDETFKPADVAGRTVLTPEKAVYVVHYETSKKRSDWTEIRFSDFRRFGATETLEFEQLAAR